MNYLKRVATLLAFSSLLFGLSSSLVNAAVTNICPGEPVTLNWSSSNVSGSCTPGWSTPACQFSVVPNTAQTTSISTSVSCSVSLTCDGVAANDSLSINPNQARCCGNWALSGSPVWNGSSCGAPSPASASFTSGPPSCTVPTGAYGCSAAVSWTSANAPSVSLTDSSGGLYVTTGPGSQSSSVFLPYVGGCYQIRNTSNGAVLTGSYCGTASCASGSTWNGSICAANAVPINGACGGSNGGTFSSAPSGGYCNIGGFSGLSGSGPWSWSCSGSNGGGSDSCSAGYNPPPSPVNGSCGSSNGGTYSSAPSSGFCNAGNFSGLSGSGPWSWSCSGSNGGGSDSCSASKTSPPSGNLNVSPSSCQISAGNSTCTVTASWNTSNASSPRLVDTNSGSTLSSSANGSQTVYIAFGGTSFDLRDGGTTLDSASVGASCTGGTSWNGSTCQATASPINGNCGGDDGQSLNSSPSNLCSQGSASSVSGSGPWSWSCNGSNGGSNDSCSASYTPGSCSNGATNYPACNNNVCGNGATNYPACNNNTCSNGATNYPVCNNNACPNNANNPPTCNSCNSGYVFNGSSCVPSGPSSCSNGAINYPACNSCNSGYVFNGSSCVPSGPSSCSNGAINYPACNSCGGGQVWDGSSCVTPSPASGNISASPSTCTIAANSSSCGVSFSWSSSNAGSPNVRNNTTGSTYSTSASGSGTFNVTNGANTVQIRDGGSPLDSVTVSAGCSGGSTWNGSICQYSAPSVSASFSPSNLNAGTNYALTWNASNASSVTANCSGNGASTFEAINFSPATGATKTGLTSNSMHGLTSCTLTATGPGGSATSPSFSITINPVCPANAPWDGNACVNPVPTISQSPTNTTIVIGNPVTYTVTSNDVGPDLTETSINWKTPGQTQWNWQNGNFGANVTPGNGHTTYGLTNSHTDVFTFVPMVPGTYTIYSAVLDNNGVRWTQTASYNLIVTCPRGYLNISNACVNPAPVVTMTPSGTLTIPLGSSVNFNSGATDASGDVVVHNLTWIKPDGQDRYATSDQAGTVTYTPAGGDTIPAGTGNSSLQAVFTPTKIGYYTLNFAAEDNTFAHWGATLVDRWTKSPSIIVAVVNNTAASLTPDPANPTKLRWECFNSNQATLVTTGGPTTNDFTNKSLPPSSGTFTASAGATYTLTCVNTASGQTDVAAYTPPSLTATAVGVNQATINYDCRNSAADSMILERTPGVSSTYNTTSGNRTDTGLVGGTEYTYTLRCFDGPNGTGAQIGTVTIFVNTVVPAPPAFTISAYIQRVSTDPTTYSSTEPISITTPDGQYYAWSYRITGGAASSCIMDQRNDNSPWYPTPSYSSDPVTYTLPWTSMGALDRTAFVSSFNTAHYWRLTCIDNVGRAASRIWSIQKTGAFPTVVDATLNLNCTPLPPAPTITVQCANSDYYEVRNNSTNALVGSASALTGTVPIPGDGTYRVTCKQGGSGGTANAGQYLRTYAGSMCGTTIVSFTATPRTLKAGSVSTLQWNISQPTASCTLTAAPVCTGICSASRVTDANNLTQQLMTENTDMNDPNNINGEPRKIMDAIQQEAFNNGVHGTALGKKSLRINHTTDFILNCGPAATQKVRIQVTNDLEG